MESQTRHEAEQLLSEGRFQAALVILRQWLQGHPDDWHALYLAGQCRRFTGDCAGAIELLSAAAHVAPNQAPVFLALGIAHQALTHYDASIDALRRALEIDPEYALAFNSLAKTQELAGAYEKAAHNYEAGCNALARTIVRAFENRRANRIFKHRDTQGQLWLSYAMNTALYLVAESGLDALALPTGQEAMEEERTEAHQGLFWTDGTQGHGTARLFLPNYFNTIRETLRADPIYSTLLANRAVVLTAMGQTAQAQLHAAEAEEFWPAGSMR